jgi:hypothetical protein
MTENIDLFAFYLITENDDFGETAHGPYTREEAEYLLKVDEELITGEHLATLRQRVNPAKSNAGVTAHQYSPELGKMHSEIKKWGFFLILIGVIQIITSGYLSNTWGILLVVVGLSSFYFNSPALFVVYGSTLGWASISNAFSGAGGWVAFSVLQVFFAFQTFRQYFLFRSISRKLSEDENNLPFTDKAAKPFPWVSFGAGLFSFVGIVILFLSVILLVGTGNEDLFGIVDFAEGLVIDMALIGFATGLASILTSYEQKLFSGIGMVAGALVLLLEIGLSLFG